MSQSLQGGTTRRPTVVKDTALLRLKIFPLPGMVLLPGSAVPLHIFEPRYRTMMADCRAEDYVLAVGQEDPAGGDQGGDGPLLPTVGVGTVVYDQLLPDGRSIILVQGVMRAQVQRELSGEQPYRMVRARRLADSPGPAETLRGQTEMVRHLMNQVVEQAKPTEWLPKLMSLVRDEHRPGRLADMVGSAFVTEPVERQRLLEELSPGRRLEMVIDNIAALLRVGQSAATASN